MQKYIPSFLPKMMHNRPSRPQTAPHKWTAPTYEKKREYAQIFPSLPILNNKLTNIIQQKQAQFFTTAELLIIQGYTYLQN